MKTPLLIIILTTIGTVYADDLSQRYENAYFLETAKGQTKEALDIYRKIAMTEPNGENRQVIIQSLERMLVLHKRQCERTLQEKVDHFEMHPHVLDRVIETFGKPESYIGHNTVYTEGNIPGNASFSMVYPQGFTIRISTGKIFEFGFEKPIYSARGITIGSPREDVMEAFPPERALTNAVNRVEAGVAYTDSTGSISYKTKDGVRFTICQDKVFSLSIYDTSLLHKP